MKSSGTRSHRADLILGQVFVLDVDSGFFIPMREASRL